MAAMNDKQSKEDIYDLVAEEPRPAIAVTPQKDPNQVLRPVLAYRSKKVDAAKIADPETIKNLQMPMWLLGGGVVIEIVAALLRGGGADGALVYVGVELILGTVVMLAGILIAAQLRGIDLGKFWIATFKLAAITVAPAAAVDLAYPLLRIVPIFGGLFALAGEFILYFALLGALFDLDESDTWYCVWVILIVRIAVYFAVQGILAKWG
jgi:hypothetical protein